MKAILGVAVVSGVVLASAFAWSARPDEVVYASQTSSPRPEESTGQVLYWVVRGCAEGGGKWSQGIQDGVLVGRCLPAALPHLGVAAVPPPKRRRGG